MSILRGKLKTGDLNEVIDKCLKVNHHCAITMDLISRRLFPILQLARMALVFTAISNALCTLILWTAQQRGGALELRDMPWRLIVASMLMSTGLYGFGMTLNDIIDRRRDQQLAAHRPLPSGRVGVAAAHAIPASLMLLALFAGFAFSRPSGQAAA